MKFESKKILIFWQSLVVDSYRSFFSNLALDTKWKIGLVSPKRFKELGNQNIECEAFENSNKRVQFYKTTTINIHTQIVIAISSFRIFKNFFKKVNNTEEKIFISMTEPYSLTSLLNILTAKVAIRNKFKFICYSAQNIHKKMPFILKYIQCYIFRHADCILVTGQEQREVLKKHGYKGKTYYFPLWFDKTLFTPKPREVCASNLQKYGLKFSNISSNITIGYCGAISDAKGFEYFIPTIKNLSEKYGSEISFFIAGKGDMESETLEAIKSISKVGTYSKFFGPLPIKNTPDFYSLIDILVVPSISQDNWKEQFGRVIVEGMAMGCIVLGSDSGEIPNVINNKSRIFKEKDSASMFLVIDSWIKALKNPEARTSLKTKAINEAQERFSDESLAKKFITYLNED